MKADGQTSMQSPLVKALLADLREHQHFPLLVAAAQADRPRLKRFKRSQAQEVEGARAEWIYTSGQADQHDKWLALLTGSETSQQE